MSASADLERWVGAVLVPQVRPGLPPVPDDHLERFPPACVIAFRGADPGRASPLPELEDLRERCRRLGVGVPFACCDLEEGAGLHLPDATRLPPAMAQAAAEQGRRERDDPAGGLELLREAGHLTASEARAAGIELVLAPVVDVNTERVNPIIATRSFGDDPRDVTRRAGAFLEGLHRGGAGGCLKHFPGHGAAREDSHLELARNERPLEELWSIDLAPYAHLRDADAVMVGHLDALALRTAGTSGGTGGALPASLSPAVVRGVLRATLGFRGAVITDALDMGGVAREPDAEVRALEAGSEGLLMPADPAAAAERILRAVKESRLSEHRLVHAARSMEDLGQRLRARPPGERIPEPRALAERLAGLALIADPGPWPVRPGTTWRLAETPAGIAPPGGEARRVLEAFRAALEVDAVPTADSPVAIAPACRVAAGLGRSGMATGEREAWERLIVERLERGGTVALVWFGSPQQVPEAWRGLERLLSLIAFAPTPPMAAAAARFLRGESGASGRPPLQAG